MDGSLQHLWTPIILLVMSINFIGRSFMYHAVVTRTGKQDMSTNLTAIIAFFSFFFLLLFFYNFFFSQQNVLCKTLLSVELCTKWALIQMNSIEWILLLQVNNTKQLSCHWLWEYMLELRKYSSDFIYFSVICRSPTRAGLRQRPFFSHWRMHLRQEFPWYPRVHRESTVIQFGHITWAEIMT